MNYSDCFTLEELNYQKMIENCKNVTFGQKSYKKFDVNNYCTKLNIVNSITNSQDESSDSFLKKILNLNENNYNIVPKSTYIKKYKDKLVVLFLDECNPIAYPVIQIWDSNLNKTDEIYYTKYKCTEGFQDSTFHLNNFIFIQGKFVVKLNIENKEIMHHHFNMVKQIYSLTTQNKTNLLYVGSEGKIFVLNIKTLNLLKVLNFEGDRCFYNSAKPSSKFFEDSPILSLEMIYDTLYISMHDDFQDELLIIENVNEDTHYSKYQLNSDFWSTCLIMKKYDKYLYLSGECGIHIFDTIKKEFVKMKRYLETDIQWNISHFNIIDNFLVNCYHTRGIVTIVDLRNNYELDEITLQVLQDKYDLNIRYIDYKDDKLSLYSIHDDKVHIEVLGQCDLCQNHLIS